MSGVFELDNELFRRDPIQKNWSRQVAARQGTNLPIYSPFWQLELSFGILDTTEMSFFDAKFQEEGLHTLKAPHPESGILTLFTGISIRDFVHTFNSIESNDWNTNARLTLARIVVT